MSEVEALHKHSLNEGVWHDSQCGPLALHSAGFIVGPLGVSMAVWSLGMDMAI